MESGWAVNGTSPIKGRQTDPQMETWTEINLVSRRPLDETLLVELIEPLVHEQFADDIVTWFWFWEPELRLRLRWRDPEEAPEHRRRLGAALDSWRANARLDDWYEGAHGQRGEQYTGEADHYGAEIWESLQADWMSGSELALAIVKNDRAGRLTKPRDYHWQRRVHLLTNQLMHTRDAEIEMSLRQALGYTKRRGGPPTPEARRLIEELHGFVEGS
jgi:Lantibiotic biosynthesis dehydratase C-term